LALSLLAGCTTPSSDGGEDSGPGYVGFYVKDAPSDEFSSVFVTFSRVDVHRAGGADENATESPSPSANATATTANSTSPSPTNSTAASNSTAATASGSDAGWITIVNSSKSIDLKQFQGDAKAFLGGANISAGKYTQIRIYVDRAYGVKNGTEVNFTVPSGTLKIVRPWTVEAGKETRLVVDFDLDKSIQKTGNGAYHLKPTLKLEIEHVASGSGSEGATEASRGNNTHKPTDKGK
jgi:uncharacterized protein DUF4382